MTNDKAEVMEPFIEPSMIGDPASFAIEYQITSSGRPFGRVRLWFNGCWVGDFRGCEFFETMCTALHKLRSKCVGKTRLEYQTRSDVPSYETYERESIWSLGEAFDGFGLIYYAVMEEQVVEFSWKVSDWILEYWYPDYPRGVHKATIPFSTFDSVATTFLTIIYSTTLGWERWVLDL